MKLNINFNELDNTLQKFNIKTNEHYKLPPLPHIPLSDGERKVLNEGVITPVDGIKEFYQGEEKPLLDRGTRILVHIMDTRKSWLNHLDHIAAWDLPKVHLVWCRTLKRMYNEGRYDLRYVKTTRSDRKFRLIINTGKERLRELNVCLNCLRCKIIRQNYSGYTPSDFPLKKFLSDHTEEELLQRVPTKGYMDTPMARNFNKISKEYKAGKFWVCEQCNVNTSANTVLLDTHHVDGNHNNNNSSNLKALCHDCHTKEHGGTFRNKAKIKEIQNLRWEQGISPC